MSRVTPRKRVDPARRDQLVDERFEVQRFLWKESHLPRVRHCGNSMTKHTEKKSKAAKRTKGLGKSGNYVGVKVSGDVVGFSGLQTCGSVHACAVCSQKIQARRATEIQDAVDAWQKMGGRVLFCTLTMRHNKTQKLNDLMDAGSYAWGRVTSGRDWVADCRQYGEWLAKPSNVPVAGPLLPGAKRAKVVQAKMGWRINFIRLSETTRTVESGWHTHFHTLLFVKGGMVDSEIELLTQSIYGRWANALVKKGLSSPTPEHGIDVRLVRDGACKEIGDYFSKNEYVGRVTQSKIGLEMAYSAGKTGKVDLATGKTIRRDSKTPFRLLAEAHELGDAEALDYWHEWEKASKGRRQVTWSQGLRWLLYLDAEKSDEDIAAEDIGGDTVFEFDKHEWKQLRWHKGTIVKLTRSGIRDKEVLVRLVFDPPETQSPPIAA